MSIRSDRVNKIASKIVSSMSQTEQEDWSDSVESLASSLSDLSGDLNKGDLSSFRLVEKWFKGLQALRRNLDDPALIRSFDEAISETAKALNGVESEKRRQEDEEHRASSKCKELAMDVRKCSSMLYKLGIGSKNWEKFHE